MTCQEAWQLPWGILEQEKGTPHLPGQECQTPQAAAATHENAPAQLRQRTRQGASLRRRRRGPGQPGRRGSCRQPLGRQSAKRAAQPAGALRAAALPQPLRQRYAVLQTCWADLDTDTRKLGPIRCSWMIIVMTMCKCSLAVAVLRRRCKSHP